MNEKRPKIELTENQKKRINELCKKLKGKTANADLYNEVEEILNRTCTPDKCRNMSCIECCTRRAIC